MPARARGTRFAEPPYLWAINRRCHFKSVRGITRVVSPLSPLGLIRLALAASRRRWSSLKPGFLPSCSFRTRTDLLLEVFNDLLLVAVEPPRQAEEQ